jgi:DinB superfamily
MRDALRIIDRLARFPSAFQSAVQIVAPEDARWKPAPEHWSILEIACHMLDEEREDFRPRIRSTLEAPEKPWPALDLDGVAERRGYNDRDLPTTVKGFVDEREASIAWLRSLETPDWTKAYIHPKVGPVAAGELLAAWSAHDALHLRQISKRIHNLAGRDGEPYSLRYAGEWTA